MDELIAFLSARLDEDEQIAEAATPGPWVTNGTSLWRRPDETWDFRSEMNARERMPFIAVDHAETSGRNTDHIARHDPPRILRRVAAGRAILDAFEQREQEGLQPGGTVFGYHATGLLVAIRHLATEYADHPDYREEWQSGFINDETKRET